MAREQLMIILLLRVTCQPSQVPRGCLELEIPGSCLRGKEHEPSQTSDSHRWTIVCPCRTKALWEAWVLVN